MQSYKEKFAEAAGKMHTEQPQASFEKTPETVSYKDLITPGM